MQRILEQVTKFFAKFLAALGLLFAARYPVVPERLLAVYRVDQATATTLSSALTLVGFAACMFVVASQLHSLRVNHRGLISTQWLAWVGPVFLATCALGLLCNSVLVRVSTRIANAIRAAEEREAIDRLARDRLVEFSDESINAWKRYRLAGDFLEIERVDGQSLEEILDSTHYAPLQNQILSTYVGTICSLKLGLFMTASTLYIRSQNSSKRCRRAVRSTG